MKSIVKLKKKYSRLHWYQQQSAVKPFYVGTPWQACCGFSYRGKRIRLDYRPFGVYFFKDFFYCNFSTEVFKKVADFYWHKELKSPGNVRRLMNRWKKIEVSRLKKEISVIESSDLRLFPDLKFATALRDFLRVYMEFWRESIFLDSFDVMSDVILEQALEKEKNQPHARELQVLVSPESLSWLQREKTELLALISEIKKDKKEWKLFIRQCFKSRQDGIRPAKIVQMLMRHAKEYHWLLNDYAIIRHLDWKYFCRQALSLAGNPKKIVQEFQALGQVRKIKLQKGKIMKKLKLSPDFKVALNFLVALAEWRDWRKALNQRSTAVLEKFAMEISRRLGWKKIETEYIWWEEARNFSRLSQAWRQLARKRRRGMFINGSYLQPIAYGRPALALDKFMNKMLKHEGELTGRTAYHGLVRGRAKIVRTQKDFKKMKPGDILIAPNTRPEYVPIMKIAGAIVSEEGGLTCHTAIVARELKIPAVVGVQGIMTRLKDGDQIEVNANSGVIKKV